MQYDLYGVYNPQGILINATITTTPQQAINIACGLYSKTTDQLTNDGYYWHQLKCNAVGQPAKPNFFDNAKTVVQ